MAADKGGGHIGGGGSFSQLLLSDDADVFSLDIAEALKFSSSSEKVPKMLCFGNFSGEPPKSGVTCSDSSSASSGNNCSSVSTLQKSNKKRNGVPGEESVSAITTSPAGSQRSCKKTKSDNPTSTGHTKVRKEKLGERITTLQQLVSPYGKTDTASVLHEAMGYIRFLHDQVQVLCSPYLQRLPSSPPHRPPEGGEHGGGKPTKDLRSRGLCLVPLACTVHVENSNGADLWSPAMGNTVPLSSKK